MSNYSVETVSEEVDSFSQEWGWILFTGIIFLVLGIFAFTLPVASTIGINFLVAALLTTSGVFLFIQALRLGGKNSKRIRLFQSILPFVIGCLMFRYPDAGMFGIALAMSFYFLIQAAFKWILASASLYSHKGWGFVSGALPFVLGVYIIATFPFSASWVPGMLLGIDFVFTGSNLIVFSFSIHNLNSGFRSSPLRH